MPSPASSVRHRHRAAHVVSQVTVGSRPGHYAERVMSFEVSLPPQTVLVVDDDAVVRCVVQGHLSSSGYRIFEAEDGQEALEVLERNDPSSLVFLIVVMTRSNGPELVTEV